ncbi:MAG TPA: Rrf2 family transcriptional regulator [Polyangiaceae bacterium]|nr:Rrf2 family transcriptional regulator [Polyangiaceae bacterium]
MAITRKTTYALRALAGMAKAPNELHSVTSMVEVEGIPKAYLSAILNTLVRYGLILSRRGPSGGYVLAKDPTEISLARVVEVLEGPLFPVGCLGPDSEPCRECGSGCAARWALGAAARAAWQALESICVADLTHCPSAKIDRHVYLPVFAEKHAPARSLLVPLPSSPHRDPKP